MGCTGATLPTGLDHDLFTRRDLMPPTRPTGRPLEGRRVTIWPDTMMRPEKVCRDGSPALCQSAAQLRSKYAVVS